MNYLDAAREAAREAGELLKKSFRTLDRKDASFKGKRNPVTRLDRECETLIVGRLKAAFPSHGFLAEEDENSAGLGKFRWIIDPLDGTVNYLHGHPFYAVSIALEAGGELVLGVVHAPALGEMFWAERGKGAFLNGKPISVSRTDELIASVLATGFAYNRGTSADNNVDNFSRLVLAARGIRRAGAAAIDLAYVAAGVLDGFWELFLQPWDVAAGAVLVREAGGKVTDFAGGDNFLFGNNIVASNGLVHEAVRSMLAPFDPEPKDK
jgi:myo-inositol-1(or 4)-monophosphatase